MGVKGLSRIYSVRERDQRGDANYRYEFKDTTGKRRKRYFCANDDDEARNRIANELFLFTADGEDREMDEVDDE